MAYITQYEADMAGDARNRQNQAAIGNAFISGLQDREQNRQRALAQKRAQEDQNLQYAANGASPEMIDQANTGDMSGIQKLYSDNFSNKKQLERDKYARDIEEDKLNKRVKESTIAANESAANDKAKPFLQSREGQAYIAKEELQNQQRQNNANEDFNRDIQKDYAKKNVQLSTVKTAMDAALSQLQDPGLSEDEKIKAGQGLLKLLNSAEGSDAVGAEEAKRIGSYLEYQMGNFTGPGNFIGRDMGGFTEQVKNNSSFLADRIKRNEEAANALKQGKTFSEAVGGNQVPPVIQQKLQQMTPDQKAQRLQQLKAKAAGFAMGGQ